MSVSDSSYCPPEWLRYSRSACYDGYSPPSYPTIHDFDAERIVRACLDIGANLLRFQPIGYWAYYPSKHFRVFPHLNGRDLIDEVAEVARRNGLHVYCYTGFAHPHMEPAWVEQHPEWNDWICRQRDGRPRGGVWHYGSSWRLAVHRLGQTYREAIRGIAHELCSHDIDGVYFDAPSGTPMYLELCFCDECARNFSRYSGMSIDRLADEDDGEAHLAWRRWTYDVMQEDLLDLRKIVHGHGKFMLCHNGSTWTYGSVRAQYHIPDGFMVEFTRQTSERIVHGLMGASMARDRRQLSQMYVGSYDVTDFTKPPHSSHYYVHNTNLEDGDEVRMEGFTSLACGTVPLYCTLNRLLYGIGSGSSEPIREVFGFQQRHGDFLRDSMPAAQIALVPSWDSLKLCQSGRTDVSLTLSEAMGLVLLDEQIAFDVCASIDLTIDRLREYRVVILCGATAIGDGEAQILADWVYNGGGLLATWDTGRCDIEGFPRNDGGALASVLGIDVLGDSLEDQPDIYIRVKAEHAALGKLREGDLIIGDGRNVPIRLRESSELLAEFWDLGRSCSRGPAIVLNHHGRGRAIYVSGALEGYYPLSRVPSVRHLFGSMVRWLGDIEHTFALKAPEGVYGILRRSTSSDLILWLLAPIGAKDASVGRMRQAYLAIENIEVHVALPPGFQPDGVTMLRAGCCLPWNTIGDTIVMTLPRLHIAEALHIRLIPVRT